MKNVARVSNPKRVSIQTLDEYVVTLTQQHKYTKVGQGAFATVFRSPDKKNVIKVGHISGNQSYLDFVEYAVANPDNAWFPNIHDVGIYTPQGKRADQRFFAVQMEVLKPIKEKAFESMSSPLESPAEFVQLKKAGVIALADDFCDVLQVLNKLSRKGHFLDVHSGNIMLRGKQFVVTDPVTD